MSVKALDDARKEIELPDELESILHVLVYEASKHIRSNLSSVEGFMSAYFDGSHRDKLEFYCGHLKRTSMIFGKIVLPNNGVLVFLRSNRRVYRPLPSRARTEATGALQQADSAGEHPDDGEEAPQHEWHAI